MELHRLVTIIKNLHFFLIGLRLLDHNHITGPPLRTSHLVLFGVFILCIPETESWCDVLSNVKDTSCTKSKNKNDDDNSSPPSPDQHQEIEVPKW